MILNINIQGLKCFDEASLEFQNLTLLAGINSAGKSTIIQALLVMFQNGSSSLSGNFISIGKVSELKNKIAGSKEIKIQVTYEDGEEIKTYGKNFLDDITEIKEGIPFAENYKILYIAADRVGVQDTYKKSLNMRDEIGVQCEYAFQYLEEHASKPLNQPEFLFDLLSKTTFGGQVDYWLERILGFRIAANAIEGTELVQASYSNPYVGNNIRPKNVGTGVSYIAEIIIAALSCKKGDLLIVENPEIHLHPSAQSEFMEFMVFLAHNGLQIIIETHSDHIFNGVRKYIYQDRISNDEVSVYFFAQREDRVSIPIPIELDEQGRPLEFPDGMFDQIDKDLNILLGW